MDTMKVGMRCIIKVSIDMREVIFPVDYQESGVIVDDVRSLPLLSKKRTDYLFRKYTTSWLVFVAKRMPAVFRIVIDRKFAGETAGSWLTVDGMRLINDAIELTNLFYRPSSM